MAKDKDKPDVQQTPTPAHETKEQREQSQRDQAQREAQARAAETQVPAPGEARQTVPGPQMPHTGPGETGADPDPGRSGRVGVTPGQTPGPTTAQAAGPRREVYQRSERLSRMDATSRANWEGRRSDDPFPAGVMGVDADSGEPITLGDFTQMLRQTIADAKARDWWSMARDVGWMFAAVADVGGFQHAPAERVAIGSEVHADLMETDSDWEKACREWEECKADCIAFAPRANQSEYYPHGPTSGAAMPLAPRAAGVTFDPSSILVFIQAAQMVIQFIQSLRRPTPPAPQQSP